jgi:LCP family protein required for cell wall assembly
LSAHRLGTKRRKRPLLVVLLALLGSLLGAATVMAIVATTFVGGLARSYERGVTTIPNAIPQAEATVPASPDGALNVLFLGSDSRVGTDAPDVNRVSGSRSDSMMLVHIPADRSGVQVMSLLRDSWVDVPGHGMAKLNAAYAWGGVPLTVQTVQNLLGVRIDHVAEIGFNGFKGMTDALGGVDVDSQKAFAVRDFQFQQGVNHLGGDAALAFVRARYPFADADHQRVRNQQSFLRGIANGALSRGTLTSPGTISDFVAQTAKYLSVDEGLTFGRIGEIGWSLRDLRSDDILFMTIPTAGGGTSADGQSYVALSQPEVDKLTIALRSDAAESYFRAHGAR